MTTFTQAEYIWLDGTKPVQQLRSKTRILRLDTSKVSVADFPEWGYDGSSTYQSPGGDSDLKLKPVCVVDDPIRGANNYLVMCEVLDKHNQPHETNARARLRAVLDKGAAKLDAWFGFEQEYTLYHGRAPLGWPEEGYPAPQGPFYCSVGAATIYGRDLVELHTKACLEAGIMITGTNAEVMPGQWEYQIGYRGVDGESADPLTISDHLWLARWLMARIGEDLDIRVSLDCKPVKGDWNGAGMHTNFSTKELRGSTGLENVGALMKRFEAKHEAHIAEYGFGLEDRLTGHHETCSIHEFRYGVADRGASIRIPRHVSEAGRGYIEDRRPGANADPYRVAARILLTVADIEL